MDQDGDGSTSGSFQDIHGHDYFKAGYSVSYRFSLTLVIIYCFRLVMWMQIRTTKPSSQDILMVVPLLLMDPRY